MKKQNDILSRLVESDLYKFKMNELRLVKLYEKRPQDLRVSIIMPAWNRDYCIDRAVKSIIGQKYQNFELIISDDGSTDLSLIHI